MRDIPHLRVVVTGASSGVGRATARAFARRGARVALAGRAPGPLEDAARECSRLGGHGIAVPTDVTDPEAVLWLAQEAARQMGGIDVWVNNAGVGVVGAFDQVPLEAHRRTIETNLFGYVHGAHAVLPYFFRQGSGVLINNGSIGAFIPTPYAAAYAASKFGVRGFSNALRQELKDWPDIHVCAIHPFMMDTPGVQHGGNYTGAELKAAPPAYDPARTAEAIVHLALHPRRELLFGVMTRLAVAGYSVTPALVEWALARFMEGWFSYADPSPVTDGNLFEPMPHPSAVHGGWRWSWPRGRSGEVMALAAAAGIAAAGVALFRGQHQPGGASPGRSRQRPPGRAIPRAGGRPIRR